MLPTGDREVWSEHDLVALDQGEGEGDGEGKPLHIVLDEVHGYGELRSIQTTIAINIREFPVENEYLLSVPWGQPVP